METSGTPTTLNEWMDAGRQYAAQIEGGAQIRRDLKLEAMAKVTNREMPVLLSANGERDIRNAAQWAMEQNIRYVITGGQRAWKIADWLAENDVPLEAALEAITKTAAEMLGLADRIGTIEEGKIANIIVTDGNPLEIQTNVTDLFILGRSVETDNKHRSLYEKYKNRPRVRIVS